MLTGLVCILAKQGETYHLFKLKVSPCRQVAASSNTTVLLQYGFGQSQRLLEVELTEESIRPYIFTGTVKAQTVKYCYS